LDVSDPPDGPSPLKTNLPSPVFGEKAELLMENTLRNWKCRNCGRANRTEVALDGTAKCEYCTYLMSVQPSRVKNGVTLPSSYPTRRGTAASDAPGRPLGEAN
jgi:hypothetical protein